jgi:hypothetical protein
MSDCHRCAALSMIAFDSTLTALDMIRLARDALNSGAPCGRPLDPPKRDPIDGEPFTIEDYEKIAAIPEPTYNPDDPDNPMLDILLPSVTKEGNTDG